MSSSNKIKVLQFVGIDRYDLKYYFQRIFLNHLKLKHSVVINFLEIFSP